VFERILIPLDSSKTAEMVLPYVAVKEVYGVDSLGTVEATGLGTWTAVQISHGKYIKAP